MKKRCLVCGDAFHSRCEKEFNSINCKGKHKTNYRGCDKFIEYKINKIMAENNTSPAEAKRIIKEGTVSEKSSSAWTKGWPTIQKTKEKRNRIRNDRNNQKINVLRENTEDSTNEEENNR